MDKLLSKLWLPVLTLGLTLGLSAHADCPQKSCQDVGTHIPLPPGNGEVPVNLPALVIRTTWDGDLITYGADRARLLRADGSPVLADIRPSAGTTAVAPEYVVLPDVPLTQGESYRLEARAHCGLDDRPLPPISATFTVGPARPLPETIGRLEVTETGQGALLVGSIDQQTCVVQAEAEAAFARLRFVPAPELVPFLPWVRWELKVDGHRWDELPFGELGPEGVPLQPPSLTWHSMRSPFLVHTLCGNPRGSYDQGVTTPGRHRVTLHATLAGPVSYSLPPAEAELELTCPPFGSSGGCSQAGGGSVLALAGLLAAYLRRRRT